jgi:DNA modification methylase
LSYLSRPKNDAAPTWLRLNQGNAAALPAKFRREDVRFSDSLVEHFVGTFTEAGQVVFDPFAGYGTTLLVAEKMGRCAYGIEYSAEKTHYVRGLLEHPERLTHGDSRRLQDYDLPGFDLCLTSPPYTNAADDHNPFVDYRQRGFDYPSYLQEIGRIFEQLARRMNPDGRVVVEVSNLKQHGAVTTLAWDVARELSRSLHFDGELVVCWERYGYGYTHSYALVFSMAREIVR